MNDKTVEFSRSGEDNDGAARALLKAATHLFARKGFDGVTLKDISQAAGANISLVSYYYDSKEGLYRACLESHGKRFLEIMDRVLKAPQSADEFRVRLEMFLGEFFQAFVDDPDQMQIVRRECEYEFLGKEEVFERMYLKLFQKIVEYFRQAQKAQILNRELDPQILAMNFFGSMKIFTEMDPLTHRFLKLSITEPRHLQKVIEHILKVFQCGVLNPQSEGEK